MQENPSQNIPPSKNKNNPTKEILASYDFYKKIVYADPVYYQDLPNSTVANTGINTTTTSTTSTTSTTPGPGSSGLIPLSSFIPFIHDILIFNNYIHYDTKSATKVLNPLLFIN